MAFPPHHHPFIFQSHDDHHQNPSPTSLNPLPPHQLFHHGGGAPFMMKRSMSFSGVDRSEEVHGDDELSDDGSQLGEKKKRLNLEQVKALEKSFELGNKLEPERKVQLAKALGLQPRQVAIWFQNRRARWKTKQLEKDYEVLKKQFESLKADNDALQSQNKELNAELLALKTKDSNEASFKKENEGSWSNGSDNNSCDANLDVSRSRNFFPSSIRPTTTTSMIQLLQGSSRQQDIQCPNQVVQEETFCNMFNGMEEQQGFWPWTEQQSYH